MSSDEQQDDATKGGGPARYCLKCGAPNDVAARRCRECGGAMAPSSRQRREGMVFLLNELETLRAQGDIPQPVYMLLRRRYREALGLKEEEAAPRAAATPAPTPPPPRARPAAPAARPRVAAPPRRRPPARPSVPRREPSEWLAEQQANLLLYLGAFLIIIATLIFVTRSEQAIGDGVKMALLVIYTLIFLAAGLVCLRFPRVRQAGVVFFAVGALMVPLDFVGAYAFFFADEDMDPTGLWLAGSVTSALFYVAVSMLRIGRWYPVPAVVATSSSLAALLSVVDAPVEAYPAGFIALAIALAAPALWRIERVSEVFGDVWLWAANVTVPLAGIAAVVLASAVSPDGSEPAFELPATLWFLPPTLALAAFFYIALALRRKELHYSAAAVVAVLSAFTSALAAAEVPIEVYPGSIMAAAIVLAGPSLTRMGGVSDVFGKACYWIANAVVPATAVWAIALAAAGSQETADPGVQVSTLWFLPPTLLLAAAFYVSITLRRGEVLSAADAAIARPLFSAAAVVAVLSAFTSALAAAEVPIEVYPGSVMAAAFVLAAPWLTRIDKISDAFGEAGYWLANAVVPAAAVAALWLPAIAENRATDWYLPPTLGLAAAIYALFALKTLEHWHSAPAVAAFLGAFLALFVLADAPPEAYPGSFIALALLLAAPSMLRLGRVSDAFGVVGSWTAHGVVPAAVLTALALAGIDDDAGKDPAVLIQTRWYLPLTGAIAALFYWTQALWARHAYPKAGPYLTFAALAVTGGAAVTLVYALDVGYQWYGPAVAIVGWLYASGSEGFGPRWFGRRHLGWMALGTVTVAWLFFEGIYGDFPRYGAGVHFAATAFYLAAGRVVKGDLDLLPFDAVSADEETTQVRHPFRVPAPVASIYAAGLTLGIGFYYLLASLPAAETATASDASWAFFGLSLAIAAVAATMRWWWPEVRLHAYVVALGMSLFVLLSSAEVEGQVTLLLAVYAAVSLAIALWERQPLALSLPAAYGFFALLAAWRHYEPNDAFLPLAFSAVGCGLFAAYAAVRARDASWANVLVALAFVYAVVAPIAGWVRLENLTDPNGFVGTERFEETLLYEMSAASVMVLGVLALAEAGLRKRPELAAAASVVLMVALLLEIGHFRPENIQAYTAPIGVYLLAAGLAASRARELPSDLRVLIEPLLALGAFVLMGPSLQQAWGEGGGPYALLLLVEGIAVLSVALIQRWVWLLSAATGFIVLDAIRYLFEAARVMPAWATLAVAGLLLLAAGMAILLGRDQWTRWQRQVQVWWYREPLPTGTE